MNKYIKFFIYGLIYVILILFFAVMFIVTTRAEIIKPNNGIEPYQVVKGKLEIPDRPGLGLDWDEEAVAHYQIE